MKKNLLITILLLFLMAMNGVLVYLHFNKSDRKGPPPHVFIVKELKFNEAQMQKYDPLETQFDTAVRAMDRRGRKLKDALFNRISKENTLSIEIDSLTTAIGDLEKERDMLVFQHFRALYEICDTKQKEKFQRIIKDVFHRHGKGKRK